MIEAAISSARQVPEPDYRAEALVTVAVALPEVPSGDLLAQIRNDIEEIRGYQTEPPIALNKKLPCVDLLLKMLPLCDQRDRLPIIADALKTALSIGELGEEPRALGLLLIADALFDLPISALYDIWLTARPTLGITTRQRLLTHLRYLSPLVGPLCGDNADQAVDSIWRVTSWWP